MRGSESWRKDVAFCSLFATGVLLVVVFALPWIEGEPRPSFLPVLPAWLFAFLVVWITTPSARRVWRRLRESRQSSDSPPAP